MRRGILCICCCFSCCCCVYCCWSWSWRCFCSYGLFVCLSIGMGCCSFCWSLWKMIFSVLRVVWTNNFWNFFACLNPWVPLVISSLKEFRMLWKNYHTFSCLACGSASVSCVYYYVAFFVAYFLKALYLSADILWWRWNCVFDLWLSRVIEITNCVRSLTRIMIDDLWVVFPWATSVVSSENFWMMRYYLEATGESMGRYICTGMLLARRLCSAHTARLQGLLV